VRRIVYLSAHGVPDTPAPIAPDGSILGSHAHLEGLIATSAKEWTLLRSSGFAANTLGWADQIRRGDEVRWFHGAARRALIHEDDLAAVAVRALLDPATAPDTLVGARPHLTGPAQLTQIDQLHAIGEALGRRLRFIEIAPDAVGPELFPGLPPAVVASIVNGHARMIEHPEPLTHTVERLLGRPAIPFTRWAHDHALDFR
jgi:uncharacterized protein YbjT (DUF2867 family)